MHKHVKVLTGDVRKAIVKLSIPLMIGGLVNTLYNVVDGIWVSGLGEAQLAAVGLFMPFMVIISALAMGIGVGGSSAISRAIGKKDRKFASNLAEHTILIGVLIGVLSGYLLIPFLGKIFEIMGAEPNVISFAVSYGRIILLASPLIFISTLGNSILRGEGDTKRAMYLMIFSSILNLILDPIFIYTFGMGVVGAAVATVFSISLTAAVITYWLIFEKNTYVQLRLRYFKFNWNTLKEILKVGLPSSFTQMSGSFVMILLNSIVLSIGGTSAMAIFSAGWRIVMLGLVPIRSIGAAITSVFGAAFGARAIKKLKEGYFYSIKFGMVVGAIIGILIFIFAPQLAYLFTYSKESAHLFEGIVQLLRFMAIYFLIVPAAMFTSSLFKGMGYGIHSIGMTIMRSLILVPAFAYLLSLVFGLVGVWVGIVLGTAVSALIGFIWGEYTIRNLEKNIN